MEVIPAIDIREGRCVRLYQGDYDRETVYSENPVETASRWADMGASRLHVVDLDGARLGMPANLEVVEEIVSSVTVPVQLGGGIRSLEAARSAASAGVERIMVGTAAIEDPRLIERLLQELGADGIIVSVDARDGWAALKGWTERSLVLAGDLIRQMTGLGIRRFLYTDIARDGTLTGPNFQSIETLKAQAGLQLLAAGGISSVEHLLRLAALEVEGAVVGKALYTGDIDLRHAMRALSQQISNST